jgi:hypothetical protein
VHQTWNSIRPFEVNQTVCTQSDSLNSIRQLRAIHTHRTALARAARYLCYIHSGTSDSLAPPPRSERKQGFSAKPVPVSAYVASSKNPKDLNDPRRRPGHAGLPGVRTVGLASPHTTHHTVTTLSLLTKNPSLPPLGGGPPGGAIGVTLWAGLPQVLNLTLWAGLPQVLSLTLWAKLPQILNLSVSQVVNLRRITAISLTLRDGALCGRQVLNLSSTRHIRLSHAD